VIDDRLSDEILITVIATGFNKKAVLASPTVKPASKLIDRIPVGPSDLQKLDEPTYMRRGVELPLNPVRGESKEEKEKIDKADPDRPAFLRKIMD
ncbi:MAG: hypothetical protein ACRDGA_05065, partial [Bacteroidota bacterium]